MARYISIIVFCCVFVAVKSNFLDNEFYKLGDDLQIFDGLKPESFRGYSDRDNRVEDIVLRYYKGSALNDYVEIKLPESEKLLVQPKFRKDYPTVLYAHGYKEIPDRESIRTIIGAYLSTQPNTNVILIDWSNMALGSYTVNAAPNTRRVGYAVAAELKKLIDLGLAMEKIHLVGHSLGGQVVGFIGKAIQHLGIKLKRISSLDPAFPMFYPGFILDHISKDDAEFVDVIHTDALELGAPFTTGTVDFWPNNGTRFQPGCPTGIFSPLSGEDTCSHWRSWRYWSESLYNPKNFMASKIGKDGTITINYMGIAAQPGTFGDYYLTTNGASPFGKGEGGIVH